MGTVKLCKPETETKRESCQKHDISMLACEFPMGKVKQKHNICVLVCEFPMGEVKLYRPQLLSTKRESCQKHDVRVCPCAESAVAAVDEEQSRV